MKSVYLPTVEKQMLMKFGFKDKKYDKDKRYYLVVVDENTGEEILRHSVIMDLVFGDEF